MKKILNQILISNINNFVHPFNNFKTLRTEADSTGKVDIHIEKVYSNEMIIILKLIFETYDSTIVI